MSLGLDRVIRFQRPLMWLGQGRDLGTGGSHCSHLDTVRHQTLTLLQRHSRGDGCGTCPACELRRRGPRSLSGRSGASARLFEKPGSARKRMLSLRLGSLWGIIPRLLQPVVIKMHYPINGSSRPSRGGSSPACPPSSYACKAAQWAVPGAIPAIPGSWLLSARSRATGARSIQRIRWLEQDEHGGYSGQLPAAWLPCAPRGVNRRRALPL